MALRLLPFRDYSEHEVINLFAYDANLTPGNANCAVDLSSSADQSTNCDAGVLVKISNGTLNGSTTNWDPVDVDSTSFGGYLGKTDYPHVGANYYPVNSLKVTATTACSDNPLGITLRQTAQKDENGEKLNYNPQKKDELYAVLPGETVPVLKRGMVTLTDAALFDVTQPGDVLGAYSNGQVSGGATLQGGCTKVGTVLASGYRDDAAAFQGTGNYYTASGVHGGIAYHKGNYYICQISL